MICKCGNNIKDEPCLSTYLGNIIICEKCNEIYADDAPIEFVKK